MEINEALDVLEKYLKCGSDDFDCDMYCIVCTKDGLECDGCPYSHTDKEMEDAINVILTAHGRGGKS